MEQREGLLEGEELAFDIDAEKVVVGGLVECVGFDR